MPLIVQKLARKQKAALHNSTGKSLSAESQGEKLLDLGISRATMKFSEQTRKLPLVFLALVICNKFSHQA